MKININATILLILYQLIIVSPYLDRSYVSLAPYVSHQARVVALLQGRPNLQSMIRFGQKGLSSSTVVPS
jgi:hypothetical protein